LESFALIRALPLGTILVLPISMLSPRRVENVLSISGRTPTTPGCCLSLLFFKFKPPSFIRAFGMGLDIPDFAGLPLAFANATISRDLVANFLLRLSGWSRTFVLQHLGNISVFLPHGFSFVLSLSTIYFYFFHFLFGFFDFFPAVFCCHFDMVLNMLRTLLWSILALWQHSTW
jgi:hypothetical protein